MDQYFRELPIAINALRAAARIIKLKDAESAAALLAQAEAMQKELNDHRLGLDLD